MDDPAVCDRHEGGNPMIIWTDRDGVPLSHGDKVRHDDGTLETIYKTSDDIYIEGERDLWPLWAFSFMSVGNQHRLTEFTKEETQ